MKIVDIFPQPLSPPNFIRFLRPINPALDTSKLRLERMLVSEGGLAVPIGREVVGVLQISYKGSIGGTLGLSEKEMGEVWEIPQVQGCRSSTSYRLATGLRWEACLAQDVANCAILPEACVQRIVMPPTSKIQNIDGAASQAVDRHYSTVQVTLGMRWSNQENLWIVDIR